MFWPPAAACCSGTASSSSKPTIITKSCAEAKELVSLLVEPSCALIDKVSHAGPHRGSRRGVDTSQRKFRWRKKKHHRHDKHRSCSCWRCPQLRGTQSGQTESTRSRLSRCRTRLHVRILSRKSTIAHAVGGIGCLRWMSRGSLIMHLINDTLFTTPYEDTTDYIVQYAALPGHLMSLCMGGSLLH